MTKRDRYMREHMIVFPIAAILAVVLNETFDLGFFTPQHAENVNYSRIAVGAAGGVLGSVLYDVISITILGRFIGKDK